VVDYFIYRLIDELLDFLQTYIGSILVAVNPYRMFNIYGKDMVKTYEGQQIGDLPP
jgi:myosin-15